MAIPTAVNGQVIDLVTQVNISVLGIAGGAVDNQELSIGTNGIKPN